MFSSSIIALIAFKYFEGWGSNEGLLRDVSRMGMNIGGFRNKNSKLRTALFSSGYAMVSLLGFISIYLL